MNVKLFFIGLLSAVSMILLLGMISLMVYMRPFEHNDTAREFVIELYQKDPKVQRDTISGTLKIPPQQFASDTLQFVDRNVYIPLSALALSLMMNLVCLFLISTHKNLAGGLFMCAAAAASFTIIPPILQVICGVIVLKEKKSPVSLKS